MATVNHWQSAVVAVGLAAVSGCGELVGLAPQEATPLASVRVRVTGDLAAVRDPTAPPGLLQVALQWGVQSPPDPSCLPPAQNPDHAAVMAIGCPDPLHFAAGFDTAPAVVVEADGTATIDLLTLPAFTVGNVYQQIAYATVIAYEAPEDLPFFTSAIYGASFSSMARPDVRVAFRHGGFDDRMAYYPRRGCAPPPEGFSILSAGGFTLEQAIEAQARGELPAQDPAACSVDTLDREIEVVLRPREELRAMQCFSGGGGYDSPLFRFDDEDDRIACISVPGSGGDRPAKTQALVATDRGGSCPFLQHFVLRGCYGDPFCSVPDWDVAPPSWWPCPEDAAP